MLLVLFVFRVSVTILLNGLANLLALRRKDNVMMLSST